MRTAPILARMALSLVIIAGAHQAHAVATHPADDTRFMFLPDGRDLRTVKVSGASLWLSVGTGTKWTATTQANYLKLKEASKAQAGHTVQWALMDLDSHQIVDQSASAGKSIFGASCSKVFVAATMNNKTNGVLSKSVVQLMSDMLVVSSNTAWVELQRQIGNGDSNKGREAIQAFTAKMGYPNTRGFQGYLGKLHGNELNASELVDFMYDTYQANYPGSENVWKIMHTSRTGGTRARKYMPKTMYVGGKTGTYDGSTEDPTTRKTATVHVRHHVVTFKVNGHQYALAVLANSGSDESSALLGGGLLREHTGYKD